MAGPNRAVRNAVAAVLAASLFMSGAAPAGAQSRGQVPDHVQVMEAYGGAYPGPQADYVRRVGEKMAAIAGRPRQCTFGLVNTNVVNAFAMPGCHVFVTRGLMALINSEDELAAVLGHEVGHIAANHPQRRQSRSTFAGLGALVVGVLTGSSGLANLASQFGQLNVLSFSRNQEFEADTLAGRYLAQGGYSPYGLVEMLDALQREDQLEERTTSGREAKSVPQWARTHPLTGDRVARALQLARTTGAPPGLPQQGRDVYLDAINGMIWGDDPSQGFVEGRSFAHPEMRIAFDAPPGFTLANGPTAVKIQGPNSVRGEFSVGRMSGGGLEDYAYGVLQRLAGNTPLRMGRPERTRINGLDAVILPALAQTQSGSVEATVAAYATGDGSAYHFVILAPAGASRGLEPLFGSFRRLTAAEASQWRPRRIQVVTVRAGDTLQSLASRMAFGEDRMDQFLVLNDLQPGQPLRPGERVKLVVWDR